MADREKLGDAMKSRGKLRWWVDFWNRTSMAYVMVFLCALYETVLLTRLALVPQSANATLRLVLSSSGWGMPLFVSIIIAAVAVLILRRSRPAMVSIAIGVLMLLTAIVYGSAFTYLLLLWIVGVYACTVEAHTRTTLVAGLATSGLLSFLSVAFATEWHRDADFTGLLYPLASCFLLSVGFGLVSRLRRERRLSERALAQERQRGLHLAQERDQALNRFRIAAELHDSVGHDLTAIIALSEGLDQVTGKPQIDDAIRMINELAREGLADTRTAVKALEVPVGQDAPLAAPGKRHHWDDVQPILDHARRIGMTVALTETGRRPDDPEQADLSFAVTREGVTNAIRHGRGVNRIVISWDHATDGAIAITIRDNGSGTNVPSGRGTGLDRLQETIRGYGGTFEAGPQANGWVVRAVIPPSIETAERQGTI